MGSLEDRTTLCRGSGYNCPVVRLPPSPSQYWPSHASQVEVDALSVPGLDLLSEPVPVVTFDLQAPLVMSGSRSVAVSLCTPTSVTEFAREQRCRPAAARDVDGAGRSPVGAADVTGSDNGCSVARSPVADCIVSWFEADLGEGGWLSTGPGLVAAGGHWVQNVQLLAEPLSLAPGMEVRIEAEYIYDRIMFSARAYM